MATEALVEVESEPTHVSLKTVGTPLAKFDAWKDEAVTLDLASGPGLMRKFIRAYEWTSRAAIIVHHQLDNAEDELKHQEAKAKLERFAAYYEANKDKLGNMKDSSALRESYLPLDPQYRQALEKVNELRAMAKFLDNKADSYRMAHDDAKKVYDKLFGRMGSGNESVTPSGAGLGDTGD